MWIKDGFKEMLLNLLRSDNSISWIDICDALDKLDDVFMIAELASLYTGIDDLGNGQAIITWESNERAMNFVLTVERFSADELPF